MTASPVPPEAVTAALKAVRADGWSEDTTGVVGRVCRIALEAAAPVLRDHWREDDASHDRCQAEINAALKLLLARSERVAALEAQLEHASAAIAGDSEEGRLWMLARAQVSQRRDRRIAELEALTDEMLGAVTANGPIYGDGKWARRSRWIDDDQIARWRKTRAGEK